MKFNEGVHDTLGMYHHLQCIVGESEKMVGLDQLQCFIGERGAVHGNLAAHTPRWMLERLFDRGASHAIRGPLTERTARGGQNQPGQSIVAAGNALKHGTVL
jgi:hypothetical protein